MFIKSNLILICCLFGKVWGTFALQVRATPIFEDGAKALGTAAWNAGGAAAGAVYRSGAATLKAVAARLKGMDHQSLKHDRQLQRLYLHRRQALDLDRQHLKYQYLAVQERKLSIWL